MSDSVNRKRIQAVIERLPVSSSITNKKLAQLGLLETILEINPNATEQEIKALAYENEYM